MRWYRSVASLSSVSSLHYGRSVTSEELKAPEFFTSLQRPPTCMRPSNPAPPPLPSHFTVYRPPYFAAVPLLQAAEMLAALLQLLDEPLPPAPDQE